MSKHKPLRILVQTEKMVGDSYEIGEVTEKVIDYHNPSDRKWLATHSWWALHNGYAVSTFPVDADGEYVDFNATHKETSNG